MLLSYYILLLFQILSHYISNFYTIFVEILYNYDNMCDIITLDHVEGMILLTLHFYKEMPVNNI